MGKNSPIKTFGFQLARAVIAAITVVFISRWLGAEGRGELSIYLFYVQILMIANEYVGGSNLANLIAQNYNKTLVNVALFWSVCVVAVGVLVFVQILNINSALFIAALSLPMAWLAVSWNLYQGFSMVYRRNKLQLAIEVFKLVGIVILAWISGVFGAAILPESFQSVVFNSTAVMWVYILVSAIMLIPAWYWLKQKLSSKSEINFSSTKELFSTGFWAQNGHLVQFLNYRLSLVLLSKLTGTNEAAGVYSNALLIADTIWIFGNSFGTIAHMRMLQSENRRFRADITVRYAVIAAAGTAIALLFLVFIPAGLYTYVFGPEFIQMRTTVLWLSPAILALGVSTLFSHYLHAVNRFKSLFLANLCGLVLQVSLAWWLIPAYNLAGAAIAADAGLMLILLIVLAMFLRENPGVRIKGSFRLKALYKVLKG